MIEAVNSVLSSAPLLRQSAEQQGASRDVSATSDSIQQVAQAPYISPFVSIDVNFDTAVILLRDSETGDTVQQIPSEGRLAAQRRDEAARQAAEQRAQELNLPDVRTESSVGVDFDAGSSARSAEVTISPSRSSQATTAATSSATPSTSSTPISQAVLSAFASGAQTAAGANTSFATDA